MSRGIAIVDAAAVAALSLTHLALIIDELQRHDIAVIATINPKRYRELLDIIKRQRSSGRR